jgi:hypothetical protein
MSLGIFLYAQEVTDSRIAVPDVNRSGLGVCTENLIRVDDVMESPKLAE